MFNGRVLGFCEFGDRGAGPELFRLYIHPRVWGRRLLSHAEMQLATSGGRHYFVTVHNGNERRKSFFVKQGFVHNVSRDSGDECYMGKLPATAKT